MQFHQIAILSQRADGCLYLVVQSGERAAEYRDIDNLSAAKLVEAILAEDHRLLIGFCQDDAATASDMKIVRELRQILGLRAELWPDLTGKADVVLAPLAAGALAAEAQAMHDFGEEAPIVLVRARLLARALWALNTDDGLGMMLASDQGFLGQGQELALRMALPASKDPPRLRDDCFAMPQGVNWVPLDHALNQLRDALRPVTGVEPCQSHTALGRVLAADCIAQRSNPPRPNAAVDGYGFAHAATSDGVQRLPLVNGRAAAGQPFSGAVPVGTAVRILTGAILPDGVDTVVLEEDVSLDAAAVVFDGPVRAGANTRKAGEDMSAGDVAICAGQVLRPPDLALLSALNIATVSVRRRLRMGVLSTGDEILPAPGVEAQPHQIFDANRPMLLSLAQAWGFTPVDLGHVGDDPALIEAALTEGSKQADVIFTSGGASAGDEDHVSALLRNQGTLFSWRIAIKPGRPLALATWRGVPVFGLPGNPVAALVCALVVGRPALSALSGQGWQEPVGFTVPAAFSKRKKAGRREFLRARLTKAGTAEVFRSEGSGRVSSLSWATGLVELPDEAIDVSPGTPVTYIPYTAFGL